MSSCIVRKVIIVADEASLIALLARYFYLDFQILAANPPTHVLFG